MVFFIDDVNHAEMDSTHVALNFVSAFAYMRAKQTSEIVGADAFVSFHCLLDNALRIFEASDLMAIAFGTINLFFAAVSAIILNTVVFVNFMYQFFVNTNTFLWLQAVWYCCNCRCWWWCWFIVESLCGLVKFKFSFACFFQAPNRFSCSRMLQCCWWFRCGFMAFSIK